MSTGVEFVVVDAVVDVCLRETHQRRATRSHVGCLSRSPPREAKARLSDSWVEKTAVSTQKLGDRRRRKVELRLTVPPS